MTYGCNKIPTRYSKKVKIRYQECLGRIVQFSRRAVQVVPAGGCEAREALRVVDRLGHEGVQADPR